MTKSISLNTHLCIAFALVFIPVCLLAGFCFFIYSLTFCGGLIYLFTTGKVDQSLWGSLLLSFFSVLCFVLEIGFVRIMFFYVNPKKERIFWAFASSLFSIVTILLAASAVFEKALNNMIMVGLFYCAFYTTGSIWALYRVHQFIKSESFIINTES
jgi:hypothetical protein